MSDTAIKFENISKQYRLGLVSTKTLSHDLNRWWQTSILRREDPYLKIGEVNNRSQKASGEYVWALRDITFDVQQGDVVGIIGKNGAGKSTLLKLLSRVTAPTTGFIKAKGKIASLLEVGTGFHPELTGRENIYMNGTILGMKKREIDSQLDRIIDFSGVEKYIDTPVKRYSSGMSVRLGFAVAAHLDPEILVVDEVLAVGDAEFQKKAIGKMQDVSKGEGRTVLFVSHNMTSMQQLCKSGVLLDNGCIAYTGQIGDVIKKYIGDVEAQSQYIGFDGEKGNLALLSASVVSNHGDVFYNSSVIDIEFTVSVERTVNSLVIGFNIYSIYGYPLARADYNDSNDLTTLKKGIYKFRFRIPAYTFSNGEYKIVFDIAEKDIKRYSTDESSLFMQILIDDTGFGNRFSESLGIKSSIIRQPWLLDFNSI
ncbi:MAG: ATP-binding cassette domain-containing protein [Prevotellaceae bacterium]|jgi:lipopolysaccharide transport system ATP-binding protein|nr:ATP-binding cassette domain-containing protein [Prevotellaceae bacterium]